MNDRAEILAGSFSFEQPVVAPTIAGIPAFDIGQSNAKNDQIPVRWAYPTSEYTTNEANVKASLKAQFNGADTQNGVMWLIK